MSYESVITALKALLKRELFELDPVEYRANVQGESDRASLILNGSMVERFLVFHLNELMPSINRDERNAVFQFEGPLGSFSNRIRMAQALGIITRKTRRQLDIVRELRNVAAHAHPTVSFDLPEIRDAVVALFDPKDRWAVEVMPRTVLRRTYEWYCGEFNLIIAGEDRTDEMKKFIASIHEFAQRAAERASHEK
jgi:hypothetical protein